RIRIRVVLGDGNVYKHVGLQNVLVDTACGDALAPRYGRILELHLRHHFHLAPGSTHRPGNASSLVTLLRRALKRIVHDPYAPCTGCQADPYQCGDDIRIGGSGILRCAAGYTDVGLDDYVVARLHEAADPA